MKQTKNRDSSASSDKKTNNHILSRIYIAVRMAIGTISLVWVSASGTKYHSKSNCSNMKTPKQITLAEAEEAGYEPCKKCH